MSGRGCVAWGGKKKIELKKKREGDGRSPNMVGFHVISADIYLFHVMIVALQSYVQQIWSDDIL